MCNMALQVINLYVRFRCNQKYCKHETNASKFVMVIDCILFFFDDDVLMKNAKFIFHNAVI